MIDNSFVRLVPVWSEKPKLEVSAAKMPTSSLAIIGNELVELISKVETELYRLLPQLDRCNCRYKKERLRKRCARLQHLQHLLEVAKQVFTDPQVIETTITLN